ncbi:MAG: hypothetical protein WCI78_11345 [Mycobacterium sp.]
MPLAPGIWVEVAPAIALLAALEMADVADDAIDDIEELAPSTVFLAA